jgi:hypothetical protein
MGRRHGEMGRHTGLPLRLALAAVGASQFIGTPLRGVSERTSRLMVAVRVGARHASPLRIVFLALPLRLAVAAGVALAAVGVQGLALLPYRKA